MNFKMKVHNFLQLFKMSNLIREVKRLGYSISTKLLLVIGFAIGIIMLVAGLLLKLQFQYQILLFVLLFMCIPNIVLSRYRQLREIDRFNEVVGYMEQMIYAFHKSGKIRESLVDVYEVSPKGGVVRDRIEQMLYIIDTDLSTAKVYQKAFAVMQREYDCTRLRVLHDYLIACEEQGGDSGLSLTILLDDIRMWSERVMTYQSDRKTIQGRSLISIVCALLSCGIMVNLIPGEFVANIVKKPLYQVVTLVIMMLNILMFIFSNTNISASYLDNELDRKIGNNMKKQLQYLADWNKMNHKKPIIIKSVAMIPLIGACFYKRYTVAAAVLLALWLFMLLQPYFKRNTCLKATERNIKKVFPIWLRGLLLRLQTDNVHMAILNSRDTAPEFLKPFLENFLDDIERDPISMKPYLDFLSEYEVPDLKLAIHYLYSLATFGSEDVMTQLDYIIKQNSILEINEEKLRNEDSLAGFSVIVMMPMIFAISKLVLDMLLFMMEFMGYLGMNSGGGIF